MAKYCNITSVNMTISGKAMPKYSYMYGQVQVMLTWVQIWQCSEKLCQELVKLFKVMTEWYKVVPRYGKVWQNYSQICPSYQKLQQYIVKLYKQSHIKIRSDIQKPENVWFFLGAARTFTVKTYHYKTIFCIFVWIIGTYLVKA